MVFLDNTREVPEIVASTGAKFWLHFCLSVLVLVSFLVSEHLRLEYRNGSSESLDFGGNFSPPTQKY